MIGLKKTRGQHMVKVHRNKVLVSAGIVSVVPCALMVACASFRERTPDVPPWCAEHLLECVGKQTWTIVAKSRHIEGFKENIWDTYIVDHGLADKLNGGIQNGKTDRLVLESEKLIAVVWFMSPTNTADHVEYEDYCYNKKTGDKVHHSYGMREIDRSPREEIDRNLRLMKNVPSWYAESLLQRTGECKWKVATPREIDTVGERTQKIFKTNDIWPEDMEKAEQENKLKILVLKSRKLTTVLWYYFRYDPVKDVVFKDFCFEGGTDEVFFSGGGEISLEAVSLHEGQKKAQDPE
jgi:hypothetical protein